MVNPDNFVFLHDMLDACERAVEFIDAMNSQRFAQDKKTVSAVLRELSVIGEAARKTTSDFRREHEEIPWEKIFGMRNKLVHDYMGVQLPIVWQTLQEDIPVLKEHIREILFLRRPGARGK